MPRVTVNVDEETEEWLQQEADRLNWSKADAGGECINLIHSAVGHIDVQQSDVLQGDVEHSSGLRERVDALEERVAMIEEARVEEIRAETGVEPGDDTPAVSEAAHAAAAAVAGEDDDEHLRDELPGSGRFLDARVAAVLAMRDELRDRGEATRDELLDAIDTDHGYADDNSFWKNAIAGRDTLRDLDGVEAPPTGRSEWRWVDDQEGGVYDPTEEF